MIGLEASLADFNAALSALDKKLGHHGLSIEIRAIGGYAMLYNKLRIGGYTMDVDTATRDISPEVMELVREIAEEKRLDEDWINNDSYILPEVVDIIDKLKWQKDDSFDNIDLYVADIGSLLILKTRAVEYGGLAPRITDQSDLLDILSNLDIHNIDELKANDLTKGFEKKYPRCFEFLKKKVQW